MKPLLTILCCLCLLGCTKSTYKNEFGTHKMRNNSEYESMKPNVKWKTTYEEGCSAVAFYNHFKFDEIVDVTITEQVDETRLFSFLLSKSSTCYYSGTGVYFKKEGKTPTTPNQKTVSSKKNNSSRPAVSRHEHAPQRETNPQQVPIPSRATIPQQEPIPSRATIPQQEPIPSRATIPQQEPIPSRATIPQQEYESFPTENDGNGVEWE